MGILLTVFAPLFFRSVQAFEREGGSLCLLYFNLRKLVLNSTNMYVKVRSMDGSQTAVLTISKLTSVSDFRRMVEEKLKVAPERQRLFYRGKQMEDGHSMFDYNININDVIQLMVKQVLAEISTNTQSKEASPNKSKSDVDKKNTENKKEKDIKKD